MKRRLGFTITELLVSMALIMFIMVILSEAFVAAIDSFRQLKALGDMENNLRATATILRRDLQADHFVNANRLMRLNNYDASQSPNLGGFFSAMVSYSWDSANVVTTPPLAPASTSINLTSPPSTLNSVVAGMPVNFLDSSGKQIGTGYFDSNYPGSPPKYNPIKLSSEVGAIAGAIVSVQWPKFPQPEGGTGFTDSDGLPSYADNGYALHFTVNLNGHPYTSDTVKLQRRESFVAAALNKFTFPGWGVPDQPLRQSTITALQGGATAEFNGQPPFYDTANYYTPVAEVAYFLRKSGFTPAVGPSTLYNLYRRQLAVVSSQDDANAMNTPPVVPATSPPAKIPLSDATANYYDFSWIPVSNGASPPLWFAHFNTMAELNNTQAFRSLSYAMFNATGPTSPNWLAFNNPITMPTIGPFTPTPPFPSPGGRDEPANLVGSDLLLTNVVNMTIRIKRIYGNNMDNDFVFQGFDSSQNPPFRVQAIEIILRVWDQKTQKTRQVTIVQNM